MNIDRHIPLLSLTALILFALFAINPVLFYSGTQPDLTEEDLVYDIEIAAERNLTPGLSGVSLDEVTNNLVSMGPINSIVIHQDGEPVVEKYFNGMNGSRTHNIKSASKSILSLLVGIAIDKGYLEGVNQEIGEFFPEYFDQNPDPVKESITIGDLLTMRSGLQSTSGGNYGRWVLSRNWVHYALDRPLVGEPGVDRIYSTGTTHLLGVILTKASGLSLRDFANRNLFQPMGIRLGGWDLDPNGFYLGGNNMALRPADMAKVGQLMLNVGSWNGEQLVSEEWITRSVVPVTGRTREVNYGYLWFRRMTNGYHEIYAWGNGSQFIKIIPELDAVIVVTTRNQSGATRGYRNRLISTLDSEIIPHLTQRVQPI